MDLPALGPALGRLITPANLGYTGILVALMAAGALVKGRRASLAVLALMIARYLAIYLQ